MRNVEIKLNLDSKDFEKKINKATANMGELKDADVNVNSSGFDKLSKKVKETASNMADLGARAEKLGKTMSLSVTAPITALGALAVNKFAEFDDQMRKVSATMGATAEETNLLTDKAKQLGSTTSFSAKQAAEGLEFMALAGFSAQESVEAIDGTLSLAAASGIELGAAADITTDTMSAFGAAASEANRFADVFATTQAKANTNVTQLGEALKFAAPNAAAFGASIEDTNAVLGTLANAGLKGSVAGNTLNAIFRDLKGSAKDGAIAIGDTAVALTNADGSYRNIVDVIRDVQNATDGLSASAKSDVLGEVFKEQSIKGVNILLSQGADSIYELRDALDNSQGAATNMANTLEGGLGGSFRSLQSATEGALIAIGEKLAPTVQKFAAFLNSVVSSFTSLDDDVQSFILTVAGVAAAIGPVLFAFGKLTTVIPTVIKSVKGLSAAMVANPAGAMVAALAALIPVGIALYDVFTDTSEELLEQNKAEQDLLKTKEERLKKEKQQILSNRDLIAEYEKTGERVEELKAKENLSGKEKDELEKKTAKLRKQQLELNKAYPDAINATGEFRDNLKSVKEETGLQNAELSKLDDRTKNLIVRFEELGKKENKTAAEKKELKSITKELNEEFPKAGISADDFTGSLERLKVQAGFSFKELERVNGQLTAVAKRRVEAARTQAKLEIDVEVDKAIDSIDSAESALFGLVDTFGTGGKEAEKKLVSIVNTFTKRLKNAGSDDFQRIADDFRGTFGESIDRILKKVDSDEIETGVSIDKKELLNAQTQIENIIKKVEGFRSLSDQIKKENEGGGDKSVDEAEEIADKAAAAADDTKKAAETLADASKLIDGLNKEIQLPSLEVTFKGDPAEKIQAQLENLKNTNIDDITFEADLAGDEQIITDLESLIKEKDKTAQKLQKDRIEIKANLQGTTGEERKALLEDLDKVNKALIDRVIKNAKKNNLTQEQLRRSVEQRLTNIRLDNEEKANEAIKKDRKKLEDDLAKIMLESAEVAKKIRQLEISLIEDESERKKAIELNALEEKFDEEKRKYEGNQKVISLLTEKYQKDRLKIVDKYTDKTLSAFDKVKIALANVEFDVSGFSEINKEIDKEISELKETYKEDKAALQEQLNEKEISQAEYTQKMKALNEELKTSEASLNEDRKGFFDAVAKTAAKSFAKIADIYDEQTEKALAAYATQVENLRQLEEQREQDLISSEEYKEKKKEIDEEIALNTKKAYVSIGLAAASSFGQLIAEGEKGSKAFAKVALDALDSLVPVLVAQITGISLASPESVASLGAAGFAKAAALTALLKGAVAAAKSAVGAEKGVVGITKAYNKKPGRTDTINAMIAPGESIINAKSSKKYEPLLKAINNDTLDVRDLLSPPKVQIIQRTDNSGLEQRMENIERAINNQTKSIEIRDYRVNRNDVKVILEDTLRLL